MCCSVSTDTAYSCDPRIKKFKEEEKARKESEKKAKADAKKREQEERERVSVILFNSQFSVARMFEICEGYSLCFQRPNVIQILIETGFYK